jgi:outer membrane protein TolC
MRPNIEWLGLALAALVAGCAHYSALPLPAQDGLRASVAELRAAPSHTPLSVADVTVLAVENNLDLRATRAQHGVAQAQLLEAGLLPNPTLTGAILPLAAGVGNTFAWNAGLSTDITALITLSARRRVAEASATQVDAQILWQEWQIAGQARLLAVDVIQGGRILALLRQQMTLLSSRLDRSRSAVAAGNATLATLAPDAAALQASRVQADDQARLLLGKRHQLAALLGLAPDAPLPLAPTPDLPRLDLAEARAALPTLPARRPDLVALRLGYAAQDAKVRAAILAQFPKLTFGVTGGSDNSNVRNVGPSISLELPVFNRNQGNIAIERATREQLQAEYAARLAAAVGQVKASSSEIEQLRAQLAQARRERPETQRAAHNAESAFASGNIDERSYVDLVTTDIAKAAQILLLEQALMEQEVAIETSIGAGLPPIVEQDGTARP